MRVLHLTGEREDMGGVLSVIRNIQTATAGTAWHHSLWVNRCFTELRRPAMDYRFSRHICSDSPRHFYLLAQAARAAFELKALLAKEPFDVLHAHTRGTLFACLFHGWFSGQPVIFTNHAYARRLGMYQWIARRPLVYTVVLTPNMARHYGLQASPPRISIISACCADQFFREPLLKPAIQGPAIRLAGVGNIMRWKNWHLIARALNELTAQERSRIQVSIWGPTPSDRDSQKYELELREQITQCGLSNHILLRGGVTSINEALQQADWFILPSTNEPCSVALIEALALGLPALVTASGGNIDIVQPEKTGLLFRPNDPKDLAASLRKILHGDLKLGTPEQRRESVRQRSASAVGTQYLELYEKLSAWQFFDRQINSPS